MPKWLLLNHYSMTLIVQDFAIGDTQNHFEKLS